MAAGLRRCRIFLLRSRAGLARRHPFFLEISAEPVRPEILCGMTALVPQECMHHLVTYHTRGPHFGLNNKNPVARWEIHSNRTDTMQGTWERLYGNRVEVDCVQVTRQLAASLESIPERTKQRPVEIFRCARNFQRLIDSNDVAACRKDSQRDNQGQGPSAKLHYLYLREIRPERLMAVCWR